MSPKSGLFALFKPWLHDFSQLGFDLGSFVLYRLLALISEDIGNFRIGFHLQNELDDFVVFTLKLLDCLINRQILLLNDALDFVNSSSGLRSAWLYYPASLRIFRCLRSTLLACQKAPLSVNGGAVIVYFICQHRAIALVLVDQLICYAGAFFVASII